LASAEIYVNAAGVNFTVAEIVSTRAEIGLGIAKIYSAAAVIS
jgi:hypothetical protein